MFDAPRESASFAGRVRRPILLLLLWAFSVHLPGLLDLPPGDRDESRFAVASRQMIETGDLVRIRYQETERNRKPVGVHWAQVASVQVATALGGAIGAPLPADAIWPYRIPSLLGGVLAALLVYRLGRGLVGQGPALVGAMLLTGCLVLGVETRIAKTDAALLAATTAALLILARAYVGEVSRVLAVCFWFALGLGVLLKGPITPLLVLLGVVALAIADRSQGPPRWLLRLKPWPWALLTVAVAAPWLVAIGIATEGRFFADALGGDLGEKLVGGDESHGAPPGYYLLAGLVTGFPIAPFLLAAAPWVWRERHDPTVRVLLALVIPGWLVFELVPTKLPHYTLPFLPMLALLVGLWLERGVQPRGRLRRVALGLLVVVPVAIGIAAAVLPWLADREIAPVGLLALAVAIGAAWWAGSRAAAGRWRDAALAACFATPVLSGVVLGGVLPGLTAPWVSPRVVAAAESWWAASGGRPAGPGGTLAAVGYHEPSLVFLAGTSTVLTSADGAAAHLAQHPSALAAIRDRDVATFRERAAERGVEPRVVAEVPGFNYSRGHRLTMVVFSGK